MVRKYKANSISTELCSQVKEKVLGSSDIKTSEDLEFDPKKDAELLSLGIRPDGGSQIAAPKSKTSKFKSTELDLGKYMSTGYNVAISGSTANKKVGR